MDNKNVPFALPRGTVIAGYEIGKVLGVGGFGITYEGYNPVTKRKAAIKEFFPRGIASRDNATEVVYSGDDAEVVKWALDRFRRSTTELCEFQHPNIVPVLNYVPAHETGYMFMEQVDGETFESWLRARGDKVTFDEIVAMLDPICDALEYVHGRKFIHRDIAPDNIMVREDGRPMLIDFGAIKIIAQQTQLRATVPKSFGVAKQHYSPPEQLDEDAQLDPRADVYALGAVLYRAVASTPPIDADKRKSDLILKGNDPYVPVGKAARIALPAAAAEMIDRALSLRPEGRQESVAEFRAGMKGNTAETRLVQATQLQRPLPMSTPGFSGPPVQTVPHAFADQGQPQPTVPAGNAAHRVEGQETAAVQPRLEPRPDSPLPPRASPQQTADGQPHRSNSWIGIAAIAAVVVIIGGVFVASALRTHETPASTTVAPPKQQQQTKQPTQPPAQDQTRTPNENQVPPPANQNDRDTDGNDPYKTTEKDTGE